MKLLDWLFRRSRGWPFHRAPETEVDDELGFHLEQRVRDYVARGMDPAAARHAALERLGDLSGVRRDCAALLEADRRTERRRDWFDDLRQDLRFGIRAAVRAPLFSLVAILTLAFGLGANAAVFGVVKSVLLDALPYADAGRLVRVYAHRLDGSLQRSSLSAGVVTDIRQRQRWFSRLGWFMHNTQDLTYLAQEGPRLVKTAFVGPGFFETLGVAPLSGRILGDADANPGAPQVAMLGHQAWVEQFARDSAVLGRTIRLNGVPHVIIGLLPPGFVGPMGAADLWLSLDLDPMLRDPIRSRQTHWLGLVARLRPGATVASANRELASIGVDLAREHPESEGGLSFSSVPLRDTMVGETRTPLLVLMASAGLVLLIACANLAGALLSRIISRRTEFAVRLALGAGRGRLVRQLLTESTLLSLVGGAAGIALATLGLSLVRSLAGSVLPSYATLELDPGGVLFTLVLSLATGVAFGVTPGLAIGRASPEIALRDQGRGASEGRRSGRLRGMLVAAQIALSVSLLAGAGLLLRSLWAMSTAPLGFDPRGVLTFSIELPQRDYPTAESRVQFRERLEERLRALPGVRAVALTSELPQPALNRNGLVIEGRTWPGTGTSPFVNAVTVSDGYFRTLGIPLEEGRTFDPTDQAGRTPAIVISRAMARRYWPDGKALGARVRLGPDTSGRWAEVIGIVGDVRNDPALPVPEPMSYASSRQDPWNGQVYLVRAETNPLGLLPAIRRGLRSLDPGIPLAGERTLEEVLAQGLAGRRLPVVLMTAFGFLAVILASGGVYAMFASLAAAREREYGVRMALGSSRQAIAGLVIRQGAVWISAGLVGGGFGIALVSRMLRGLLYQIPAFDPIALSAAVAVLLGAALVALLIPLLRATRVDPMSALR
jgi:predicted permease